MAKIDNHGHADADASELTPVPPGQAELTAARLAAIIESSDDAIIGKDLNGMVTSWNAGAERLFGYTAEEMIGQSILRLIPLERQAEETEILGRIRRGESVRHFETQRLRKNGSLVDISVTVSPIKDSKNRIVGASKVARDITARKLAEEQIQQLNRELEQRVRERTEELAATRRLQNTILSSANYGIVSTTSEGLITTFNAAAEKMLGYAAEEVIGKATPDLFHEHDEVVERAKLLSAELNRPIEPGFEAFVTKARTGQPDEQEWVFVKKDGARFPVNLSITRVVDGQNNVAGFVGIFADIEARKRANEKLRESEERFRRCFEDAPIGMALVSRDGRWLRVNRPICEMVGYSESELLALDFQTITHPDDLQGDLSLVRRLLRGEIRDYRMEKRYFRKDGRIVHVLLSVSIVRTDAGEPVYFIAQIQDITARKMADKQISEQTVELRRSNEELQQLAYVASHDMREPLRAISGFAGILKENYSANLGADAVKLLGFMTEGARQMEKIIDDLLSLSGIGAQGAPFVDTDLTRPLESAMKNLVVTIRETKAVIQHDPLPTLPVDESQITLLFQNFIGNAVKFCHGPPPRIHIRAEPGPAGFWTVAVSDNGIGIKSEYHKKIFGIFQRLHTQKEFPGTGMGLAICKKIVERHGGTIWLQSTPGDGTTFFFTLPVTREE